MEKSKPIPMSQADPQATLSARAGPARAKRPSGRNLAHWLMAVSTLVCLAGVGWQALGPGAGIKGQPVYQGGLTSGHTRQAAQSGWQSLKEAGLLTQAFEASQQAAEAAREIFCSSQQQLAAVGAGLQAQAIQVKTSPLCSPVDGRPVQGSASDRLQLLCLQGCSDGVFSDLQSYMHLPRQPFCNAGAEQ